MLPLIERGDPGIDLPLVIDGVVFSRMPDDLDATPDPGATEQAMMDGLFRNWTNRPHFDGIADNLSRYTFTFPYNALDGADLDAMDLIIAAGLDHRITIWRYMPTIYTCVGGVQRYYFPRLRKCAPYLYAGLVLGGGKIVSPNAFPTIATLNGAELDVTYSVGPALVSPGAGGLVIARDADTTGDAEGSTGMLLGDVVATGDKLVVWTVLTFETTMRAPRIRMIGSQEHHAHTFVEV